MRCVSCGTELASAALVCVACGEPVVTPERKVVTVLFADLAGYTSLAETLDPEVVLAVIRPWMTELRLVVEQHGGTVPQVMGDGFMAVFGVPNAHEDDPERAVRAGLEMTTRGRSAALSQPGIAFPGVRVGINTGEVMVAGSRESSGFAVVGDAVNVSARLASLAEAGQVLVGDVTHELTRSRIRYGRRADRSAKGKAAPLPTFVARGPRPSVSAVSGMRRGSFVGRHSILRKLVGQAEGVRAEGVARVHVIIAEPGVGKTRLAEELRARLPDYVAFAGASHPYGQRLPLAALAEAIGAAVGVAPDSPPRRARRIIADKLSSLGIGMDAVELERARTQVERVLGLADARGPSMEAGGERPGGVGVDVRQAARDSIAALMAGRPALVILDDVHWADEDQLEFLAEINRSPWPEPCLFLALSRPEPADWRIGLPTTTLAGLGTAEARTIITGAIGTGVPSAVLERLVDRAEGNPLFLEESARMLVERGALERTASGWRTADASAVERVPDSLRQLVAARIDRLPPEAKQAAQDASVAGVVTWDALVSFLAAQARRGAVGSAGIDELVARDILRRRPSSSVAGVVEFEFKHVVLRDVAYESLPRAERAIRHQLTADWLRQVQGEPAVAAIAGHYERAWDMGRMSAASGSADRARVAALAATYLGRWADSVFSAQPRLALSLYERGLQVADQAPEGLARTELARLLVGQAEGLSEAGSHREAVAAAEAALVTLESQGGPDALSTRGFALLALGRAHSNLGAVATASTLIGDALVLFEGAGDLIGQARGYQRLAEARRFADMPSQVEAYRRAFRLFGRAGASRDQALVAEDIAYLLTVVGGAEAERWLEQAREFAERSGDERGLAAARRAAAYSAFYRGELDAALAAAVEAQRVAAAIGHRWIEVDSMLIEAQVRAAAGNPAECLKVVRRLVEIADTAGARHLRALVLGAGTRALQREGHPRRAASWLATMRSTLAELGAAMEMAEVDFLEASLLLERGAWDKVEAPSLAAERLAKASGWRILGSSAPLLRGRAHLGAGSYASAERELRRAATIARATGASGQLLIAEACLRQAVAWRTGAATDPDPPVTPRRVSLTALEPLAIDFETAGVQAMRGGATSAAIDAFGRAVRAWQLFGLTVWQARAENMRSEALAAAGRHSAGCASALRSRAILARIESPLADAVSSRGGSRRARPSSRSARPRHHGSCVGG